MRARDCTTCLYDAYGFSKNTGIKNCRTIIGICGYSNNLQGWTPINDNDGFDPDRYIPQPTVMSDEKDYMDFGGVI